MNVLTRISINFEKRNFFFSLFCLRYLDIYVKIDHKLVLNEQAFPIQSYIQTNSCKSQEPQYLKFLNSSAHST